MRDLELKLADDYTPNSGELNNLVYLCCKYSTNWPMRQADLQVCLLMAGEIHGNAGISKLCEVTCEYIWDHICGEPEERSVDDFFNHMKEILQVWYEKTTVETRSCTD